MRLTTWIVAGTLLTAATASAQTDRTVTVPKVATAPKIDDYLPGGSMPGAKVTGFKQREPKDLEPASQETTAYLSYDHEKLFVGFVCKEPASMLRARMTRRESSFADDLVGIMLDTFQDKQRAYIFYSTPLGIQSDGIMSEAQGEDFSFDTEWSSEGRVTADGFAVLIAVPFKALRFPPAADGSQKWGIALLRALRAESETDFWPGNSSKTNGFIAQFGTLDGLSGISPGRNIQVTPYGTFAGARFLDYAGAAYGRKNEGRAGVDLKVVPRDAMTLDMTFNPDFSQVESDEPQVTVNQRFEVFFPEKRPFFLENSDFFSGGPFFSRRIRDPQFGARLTGKMGRWALGALAMDDRAPGRSVAETSSAYGDRAFNSVATARYDFANQSNVGFFGSTRNFGDSSNQVGSASAHVRLNKNWFFDASGAVSHNVTLDGVKTNGGSTSFALNRSGRALSYSFFYNDVSPDYNTPLGFTPRRDIRQATSFMSYRWRPKTGPVQNFGPNSYADATWSYDGKLQDYTFRLPFYVQFKGQTNAFVRYAFIQETVGGIDFDERETLVNFNSSYIKWLSVGLAAVIATRPNYNPAPGVTPFLADATDLSVSLTVRPTSALLVDQTWLLSRLTTQNNTGKVFDNLLLRTRLNYQFTRAWSLRAILDYNTLDPNPALVALEKGRHFGADVLLTWLLHPGTALYVGYTDGYDNVAIDPTKRVFTTDGALSSTGRQIFVKTSWLLRF